MTDLDTLIRAAVDDIVAATPRPSTDLVAHSVVDGAVGPVQRARVAALIALAAAMVVGLVVIVTRPTDVSEESSPAAPPPVETTVAASELPVVFLPTTLPESFELNQAYTAGATTASATVQRFIVGQALPDGGFGPTIEVVSDTPESILATDGEIVFERRPVTLANGVEAEFLWWGDANQRLTLQYVGVPGRAVSISANATAPDAPIADVMLAVANGTPVVDTDAQVLGPLPDGYAVLASSYVLASKDELDTGGPSWSVNYVKRDDAGTALTVTSRSNPPTGFPFTSGMTDGYDPIDVRGHSGYVSRHDYPGCDCPTIQLTWLERPDLQITVSADSMTVDDLLTIATELQPVGSAEWSALMDESATG